MEMPIRVVLKKLKLVWSVWELGDSFRWIVSISLTQTDMVYTLDTFRRLWKGMDGWIDGESKRRIH